MGADEEVKFHRGSDDDDGNPTTVFSVTSACCLSRCPRRGPGPRLGPLSCSLGPSQRAHTITSTVKTRFRSGRVRLLGAG